MPGYTLFAPGATQGPQGYALVPNTGTTLRVSWTSTGNVSFTGYFRNKVTNALVGAQTFSNFTSGNYSWTGDPGYNGSNNWVWEIGSVTSNGQNITITFSVDSGTAYSGVNVRRSGGWTFAPVYVRRGSAWVFIPIYARRSGTWILLHK